MADTHRDKRRARARIARDAWFADGDPHSPSPSDAWFGSGWSTGSYPHWWDKLHHTRPARLAAGSRLSQRGPAIITLSTAGRWHRHGRPGV